MLSLLVAGLGFATYVRTNAADDAMNGGLPLPDKTAYTGSTTSYRSIGTGACRSGANDRHPPYGQRPYSSGTFGVTGVQNACNADQYCLGYWLHPTSNANEIASQGATNGLYQVFCSQITTTCDRRGGATDITTVDSNQNRNPCMKKVTVANNAGNNALNGLVSQLAQSNALLARSAMQRNFLELLDARDAGRTAEELKAAGFAATDLKAAGFIGADLQAAGFSLAELRAARFLTTNAELRAAVVATNGQTEQIGTWDVSLIEDFNNVLSGTSGPTWLRTWNPDLSGWDVAKGTNFVGMFWSAFAFNANIGEWDVSKGANFAHMFTHTYAFNADTSSWNVAKGTNFQGMFLQARVFNADVSRWDVAKGTNFRNMFYSASEFNRDLSGWNTARGTDFSGMFAGVPREAGAGNGNGPPVMANNSAFKCPRCA